MKVRVKIDGEVPEHEMHIHCRELSDEVQGVLDRIQPARICGRSTEGDQIALPLFSVCYFESVEKRVFAYTENQVLETECRLYELEESCPEGAFFRISKTTLVNISKVEAIRPEEGRRLKLRLKNGEWLMVSRLYAGAFRKRIQEGIQ